MSGSSNKWIEGAEEMEPCKNGFFSSLLHEAREESEGTSMPFPGNLDIRSEAADLSAAVEPSSSTFGEVALDPGTMRAAVLDSGFSLGRASVGVQLPWEMPGMNLIFGEVSPGELEPSKILPTSIALPLQVQALESASSSLEAPSHKRARTVLDLGTCYRKIINFSLIEDERTLEATRWSRALETWLSLVTVEPEASLIGKRTAGLPGDKALTCLRELFGRKAVGTVAKRGSALYKYVAWLQEQLPGEVFLPFRSYHLDEYLDSLKQQKAKPGAFTGFTESVRFAVHVVGFPAETRELRNRFGITVQSDSIFSNWAQGLIGLQMTNRKKRNQSVVLTVAAVLFLEEYLNSSQNDPCDRYAAGCFLFLLFSRSRVGDGKKVLDWIIDFVTGPTGCDGFLECSTLTHKTAKAVATTGLPMPLVAPAMGLSKFSWAAVFVEVANSVGLGVDKRGEGPLLPAPDQVGGWMSRSVTSAEAGAWLRQILKQGGHHAEGVTGHSLKSTTLSWATKFGLDKHRCLQLGHHATGDGALRTYGRDFLAPALRQCNEMLTAVRNGVFFPDLSRSGRFQDSKPASKDFPVKVEDSGCESSGPASFDLVSQAADEQEVLLGDFEGHGPPESGPGESPGSASSSSSTSSEEEAELRCPEPDGVKVVGGQASRPQSWRPDCSMYKHTRTQVVHLKALGSTSNSFVCGRKITADYTEINACAFLDVRKCRSCEGAKPIRDAGALLAAIESRSADVRPE